MSLFGRAATFLLDSGNWVGSTGIGQRLAEHGWITLLTVAIATIIALPTGLYIGHTGRWRGVAVGFSGGIRALPTLGVLTLFALWFGIGLDAPLVALVILALPSILAGAYSGVESVDAETVDAARAQGMTEWQILVSVEMPLALPLIVGGIRSATLQVVATATLAAYVGAGGLGSYVFLGLSEQDYPLMLAVSLLIMALAVVLEAAFAMVQRLVTPRGVTASQSIPAPVGVVNNRKGIIT